MAKALSSTMTIRDFKARRHLINVARATAGLLLTSDRWEHTLVSTFDTEDMADFRTVLLQGTLDLLTAAWSRMAAAMAAAIAETS